LISKKSSPLKPLGQINQNLVGSILGRSSIKIAHSFGSFGQAVSEKKIFFKSTDQKQELPMVAMFVNESGLN
jgi:hypothetical protein